MAAIYQQRHRQLANLVCDKVYTVEDLCKAAWDGGDIDQFKQMLNFLSVDEINKTNSRGQTALVRFTTTSITVVTSLALFNQPLILITNWLKYCAARKGFVDYVEALLSVPGIDVNKGEVAKKSTPLHGKQI